MLSKNDKFAHFQIEEQIGRGGMGVVFRAHNTQTDQIVALKLLAPYYHADPDARKRFAREASLVAQLDHPHIAKAYEHGEADDQLYIALEWVDGQTLKTFLDEKGALPVPQALAILDKIAAALDYAHTEGVVHRDLKPSNILITADENIKIVDFGLGRLAEQATMTATDAIMGTPHYMSPEQFQGGDIDGRADQYAIAIVLYEMLVGQRPFSQSDSSGALHQQLYETPTPITELLPTLPVTVEKALLVALEKKPDNRFADMKTFVAACRGEVKIPKRVDLTPQKSYKPMTLALAGVVGVVLLFFAWQWLSVMPEEVVVEATATAKVEIAGISPTPTRIERTFPTPEGATPCNMLEDPQFEFGVVPPDYFETAGVKSLAENAGIDGTTALRIGSDIEYGIYGQSQLAIPGHEYTFSGEFLADGKLIDSNIGIGFLNVNITDLDNTETTISPTLKTTESITLLAPPDTHFVFFWAYKDLATGTLLADNLVLKDNTECPD